MVILDITWPLGSMTEVSSRRSPSTCKASLGLGTASGPHRAYGPLARLPPQQFHGRMDLPGNFQATSRRAFEWPWSALEAFPTTWLESPFAHVTASDPRGRGGSELGKLGKLGSRLGSNMVLSPPDSSPQSTATFAAAVAANETSTFSRAGPDIPVTRS